MNERNKWLRQIQKASFLATEAALFLDTHPHNRQALRYFDRAKKMRQEAVEQFERRFGPLTMYGVDAENGWSWATDPWPWEL